MGESEMVFEENLQKESKAVQSRESSRSYSIDTRIEEVTAYPGFGNYRWLIFPADRGYYSREALGDLFLTWYNNIDPDKTVEIVNYLKDHADAGDTVFYDIYTEEEKAAYLGSYDTEAFGEAFGYG